MGSDVLERLDREVESVGTAGLHDIVDLLLEYRGEIESLDSLRNFLGDMTIKSPVGRTIGLVECLRVQLAAVEARVEEAVEIIQEMIKRWDYQFGYPQPNAAAQRFLAKARAALEGE